jgi:hypothetical protein
MAKYLIGRGYGLVGSEETIVIEAESADEANSQAWDWAVERVSSWAEEIEESEDE